MSLGHAMSLTVTAEGVETETQKNFLHNAGCNEMQGYLFSKPIPERQVTRMLSRASSNALQPFVEGRQFSKRAECA